MWRTPQTQSRGATTTTASQSTPMGSNQLPDNVYAEPSTSLRRSTYGLDTDRVKVQWAWMANTRSRHDDQTKRFLQNISKSSVASELMELAHCISSTTVGTQTTMEPSYVQSLHNIRMETDEHRSIAIQAGPPISKATVALQVVEADIAANSARLRGAHDLYGDGERLGRQKRIIGTPTRGGNDNHMAATTAGYSSPSGADSRHTLGEEDEFAAYEAMGAHVHRPTCDLPQEQYPVYMSDARAMGVANEHGFISLPRHAVQLPPRRRKKYVSPTDVSYLYGTHELQLDENVTTHLSRAMSLWSSGAGFVPKY